MTAPLLLCALLCAQSPGYYTAPEARALFGEGTQAWARQDVSAARGAWEKLAAHGHGTQEVLYNAGTAALAAGDVGGAVLFLERALRLGGDTSDIEANLAVARSRQLDQVVGAGVERTFAPRVASAVDERLCAALMLAGTWLSAAAFAWARLRRMGRGVAIAAGVLSVAVALPAGVLVATHAWVDRTVREGVVRAPTVQVRDLPQAEARVSFEMHPGLKVRLLDDKDGFTRVRLPNGMEGWATREGIEPL